MSRVCACCSLTIYTPDGDGVIVTAFSFPCNLVQAHHPKPILSLPILITCGNIVFDNTVPVPPG